MGYQAPTVAPAYTAPKRAGRVAVHDDRGARPVHVLEMKRQRALEVFLRVVVAKPDGAMVGVEQRLLLAELLVQHLVDDRDVDLEQGHQRADVGDVAQQRAVAVALERLDAHLAERDAEDGDLGAHEGGVERPGRVVQQVAAGAHRRHVLGIRRRIERDDEVDLGRTRRVAVLADPNVVERRQSLDVRREDVLPRDRNAHAEDRLHEQAVGAGRARAVDGGHLECEVVDAAHRCSRPAYGSNRSNWRMSHAAVGQRSAHSPQCRQMSSSFTITRFVCGSAPET